MTKNEYKNYQKKSLEYYKKANIILSKQEEENIEITDLGLGKFEKVGLSLVVYINTQKVCAKEMVLYPFQTCPEHMHVETNGNPGKEETFRCRYGTVHLFVDGESDTSSLSFVPDTPVTVTHEIVLHPGEQYTIYPKTNHWFYADSEGAVISEFSTRSTDETDVFTDKDINRLSKPE